MDNGIGKVLDKLDDTQQVNDTLVIFTSDNGGQINVGGGNGGLRDGKQSMYEGGLRVSTAIKWPGRVKAGTVTKERALTMDLYPTICEIAGVPIRHEIDGVSLVPILSGEALDKPDRPLFFHRREGNQRYQGLITNAVIQGDWKLLRNSPFSPLELYNLKSDPYEQENLAKQHPAIFNELARILRIQVQRGGAVPWQPPIRKDVMPR